MEYQGHILNQWKHLLSKYISRCCQQNYSPVHHCAVPPFRGIRAVVKLHESFDHRPSKVRRTRRHGLPAKSTCFHVPYVSESPTSFARNGNSLIHPEIQLSGRTAREGASAATK